MTAKPERDNPNGKTGEAAGGAVPPRIWWRPEHVKRAGWLDLVMLSDDGKFWLCREDGQPVARVWRSCRPPTGS